MSATPAPLAPRCLMSLFTALFWLGGSPQSQAADAATPDVSGGGVVHEADLVIYGGTSGGIAAAVQGVRMGLSVVIIEPSDRLGGLTTGGLGQTDIGNKNVIGGISREFYQAVRVHYQDDDNWTWQNREDYRDGGQSRTGPEEDTMWTFEPSAALSIYHGWIERDGIPVVYNERIEREGEGRTVERDNGWWVAEPGSVSKGVVKDGNRITEIIMESGKRFRGRFFIDATYEGDLFAGAGVSFTIGREGYDVYGESLNGVQTRNARHHQFVPGVDPYVIPGDPGSGLLPYIDPDGPGEEGSSDHRIQAFCFRMCLTDHPDNRIPFEKPEGYDERNYELLLRNYEAGETGMPWINSAMPNRKTDTNNRLGFSTDFIGGNYGYPEGSYEEREQIVAQHLHYQQGVMWTLAYHPRMAGNVRDTVSRFGLTKDEFPEGNGWQGQLYIREARRMIAGVVMTQHHCQGREYAGDSVGMAAYTMDSHHTQRHVDDNGHVRNEGDVQVGGFPPYPISYHSIVPREEECSNLAVPVMMSASHMAFGSIRMEPVFMILGQSAATAAAHAIEEQTSLQQIDYARLRERLLEDKQILELPGGRPAPRGQYLSLDDIDGIVVDDTGAELEGPWLPTILTEGVHRGYVHDNDANKGRCLATFTATLPAAGEYDVQVAYTTHANRATNVPVAITHAGGTEQVALNQRRAAQTDRLFQSVGRFAFEAGEAVVTIGNEGTDGHVIIDAVRWLPVE